MPGNRKIGEMVRPRIPFGRFATLTALASLPPVAVFAALAMTGRLGWGLSALSATVCVVMLAWMVRRGLGDVYRILHFSETIARDGKGEVPVQEMSGLFPEFTEAVSKLQQAWGQDRGVLDARASSAETILENLLQPLILLNAERHIVRATVGARDLLGEIVPGRELSSALRAPEILEAVDRALAGGENELIEFDIDLPANISVSAQIQTLSRPAADGSVAVVSLFDITEIKQVQKMRTDFVANASHELRTPLAVISGSIKTLQGPARGDEEGIQKFLGMMEHHTSRMTRLIEDLLSLSRIELNANTLPDGHADVSAVLSGLAETLEAKAAQRDIEIVLEPGLVDHGITGDESEIEQVFQNLIDNAIKYSDEHSVVRIVTRESNNPFADPGEHDNRYIEVAIIDNGAGIPAEHLPRLTERFYRVDTARSREMGGTGLGLAIVKHIVSRHRGRLAIGSTEGKGSTFTVYLPLPAKAAGRRG
jgi:two-component system, OmpR family, phosphate regulon sensor histidine kinase PhoR